MAKEPNNPVLVDERGNPIGHRESTSHEAMVALGKNVPIHMSKRFGFGLAWISISGIGIALMLAGLTTIGLTVGLAGFLAPALSTFRHDITMFWRKGNASPDTRAFLALMLIGLFVFSAVAQHVWTYQTPEQQLMAEIAKPGQLDKILKHALSLETKAITKESTKKNTLRLSADMFDWLEKSTANQPLEPQLHIDRQLHNSGVTAQESQRYSAAFAAWQQQDLAFMQARKEDWHRQFGARIKSARTDLKAEGLTKWYHEDVFYDDPVNDFMYREIAVELAEMSNKL